jgi:hypothetical protein
MDRPTGPPQTVEDLEKFMNYMMINGKRNRDKFTRAYANMMNISQNIPKLARYVQAEEQVMFNLNPSQQQIDARISQLQVLIQKLINSRRQQQPSVAFHPAAAAPAAFHAAAAAAPTAPLLPRWALRSRHRAPTGLFTPPTQQIQRMLAMPPLPPPRSPAPPKDKPTLMDDLEAIYTEVLGLRRELKKIPRGTQEYRDKVKEINAKEQEIHGPPCAICIHEVTIEQVLESDVTTYCTCCGKLLHVDCADQWVNSVRNMLTPDAYAKIPFCPSCNTREGGPMYDPFMVYSEGRSDIFNAYNSAVYNDRRAAAAAAAAAAADRMGDTEDEGDEGTDNDELDKAIAFSLTKPKDGQGHGGGKIIPKKKRISKSNKRSKSMKRSKSNKRSKTNKRSKSMKRK